MGTEESIDGLQMLEQLEDLKENFFNVKGYKSKVVVGVVFGDEATLYYDSGETFELVYG